MTNPASSFSIDKRDYLTRLIAPEGTARARGYLLGKHFGHEGKRPAATKEQQAAADENYRAKRVTWYDEPALRAPLPDPALVEDVNAVIARLSVFERSVQEAKARKDAALPIFSVPFPPEPPPLDQPLGPHQTISLAAQMGVWAPGMVKDVLSQDPTLGAKPTLDQIVDAVASPDPVPAGQRYPVTGDTPAHLISIARLLPRELVELIASIEVFTVTGGSGSKDNALPDELQAAVDLLACLGDLDGLPLRQGLVKLAKCLPSKLPQSVTAQKRYAAQ